MERIIIFLLLFTVGLGLAQQKPATGWYFPTEKGSNGILVKGNSGNIFVIESEPFLTTADFKAVRIVTRDFKPEPLQAIEIQLNKSGKTKWNTAKKRISKTREAVIFVYDGKVYCEKYIYPGSKTLTSSIDLVADPDAVQEIFSALGSKLKENR